MANLHASKKYLMLDDVRVYYNKKTHQIELTTGDRDLLGEPFQVKIKPGTPTDIALRALLKSFGAISSEKLKEFEVNIPTRAAYPENLLSDHEWPATTIPLGQGAGHSIIAWDTKVLGHTVVTGIPGSGKSLLARSVIQWVVNHPAYWTWAGIDLTHIDFAPPTRFAEEKFGTASDLESAVELLRTVKELKDKRVKLLKDSKLTLIDELPLREKRLMLVIEESWKLVKLDLNRPKGELYREIKEIISELAEEGHKVGIHLLITASPDIDEDFFSEKFIGKLENKIAFANLNTLLGESPLEFSDRTRVGRAVVTSGGKSESMQVFYTPVVKRLI